MERGLSHPVAVGWLKILEMIQVSSSEGEHAFWHSGMQMCASLYSNVAFWMLSSQGIGVSVEVWVEQGALPTAHLMISVLRATYITCFTSGSLISN